MLDRSGLADHRVVLVTNVLDPVGADRPFARYRSLKERIARGVAESHADVGLDHVVQAQCDAQRRGGCELVDVEEVYEARITDFVQYRRSRSISVGDESAPAELDDEAIAEEQLTGTAETIIGATRCSAGPGYQRSPRPPEHPRRHPEPDRRPAADRSTRLPQAQPG